MTDSARSRLRTAEWLLVSIGCAFLVGYGVVTLRAVNFQRAQSKALDKAVPQRPATENPTIERKETTQQKNTPHQLIGRLEIPRLHVAVMVMDGDDDETLKVAAGHLPDTPLPWEFGNSAVAAHRDGFFRPLSQIQLNDRLKLTTPHGEFHYVVSQTRIVEPDDLSVLAQKGRSSLTLITCYPFNFVGHAPKRFVIQADHSPT